MNRNLIYFGAFVITIFGFASKADGSYNPAEGLYKSSQPKEEDRCPIEGLQAILEKKILLKKIKSMFFKYLRKFIGEN